MRALPCDFPWSAETVDAVESETQYHVSKEINSDRIGRSSPFTRLEWQLLEGGGNAQSKRSSSSVNLKRIPIFADVVFVSGFRNLDDARHR
jgi:hypothetical protein